MTTTKSIRVTLPSTSIRLASGIGKARAAEAQRRELPDQAGQRGVSLVNHVLGALCECAVAYRLDVFWDGHLGVMTREDVGGFYGVRGVTGNELRLILHGPEHPRPDNLDHPFISVWQQALDTYWLRGWIWCRHGLKVGSFETHRENGGAFYVDSKFLEPMDSLPPRPIVVSFSR